MKILYIYDKMPGTYQKYLVNLLNEIKKKCDLRTLVYEKNTISDYSVIRYGIKDYFQYFLYVLKLSKFKTIDVKYMSKYDIIHVQHSFLWRKFEHFKEKNEIPKVVITLRGGDTYIKPWISKSWQSFYKDSDHITAFIVMSEHQKKYLCEKWGVSLNKIHVIPISFGQKSDIEPKFPNIDKLKLVSAFRLTWEKNIRGNLEFAKSLREKKIPFIYHIYGDGKDMVELLYLIDKYELHDYVEVKGKISNEKLKIMLPEYDFFVQLSVSESLGMSVIEAQSMGVPCVVSDSGGLPETVILEESALVGNYENVEKLASDCFNLWKNKNLYFSYSKKAISNANEKFTIEKETASLYDLYNQLIIPKDDK